MNTVLFRSLCVVMLSYQPVMVHGANLDENEYVAVSVALADSLVRGGDTTFVVVHFTPAGGISLNTDPPPDIVLRPSSCCAADRALALPVDKDSGYLDPARPLRKAIYVRKAVENGRHFVSGTLRYFFCSDSEGWCTRSSVEFELPLTIVQ